MYPKVQLSCAAFLIARAAAAPQGYNYQPHPYAAPAYTKAPTTVTSTTYLNPGVPEFTSTIGNTVLVGKDLHYNTITKTIAVNKPGYTSTIAQAHDTVTGTVEVGVPCEYVTSTSWCPSAYTSTMGDTVVICNKQSTVTRTITIPAQSPAYTSTAPAVQSIAGTVVVAQPVPYVTSSTCASSMYTSTVGGTVIVAKAQSTTTQTATLTAGAAAFTSTIPAVECTPGTVIVGRPVPYVTTTIWGPKQQTVTRGGTVEICNAQSTTTQTSTLPAGAAPFTTTIPAVQSVPGTVIVGQPKLYVTTTTCAPSKYISTTDGTVIIATAQSTVTKTSLIPATATPYTSTVPAVQCTGTIIIGQPTVYTTITKTTGTVSATTTIDNGATGTVQVTVPETPVIITSASCDNNGGVQYAIYNNPFAVNGSDRSYPTFDPSYFQRAPVLSSGLTQTGAYLAAGIKGETVCAYGSETTIPANKFAINHKAYLYGEEAGTYTFTTYHTDDFFGLWVGTFAVRDYTRKNAVFEDLYYQNHAASKSYTVTLKKGQYLPFRIIYANGGGPAILNYQITTPSGKVVVSDSTTNTAPYVVTGSCDGTPVTPAFKPWGAEIY